MKILQHEFNTTVTLLPLMPAEQDSMITRFVNSVNLYLRDMNLSDQHKRVIINHISNRLAQDHNTWERIEDISRWVTGILVYIDNSITLFANSDIRWFLRATCHEVNDTDAYVVVIFGKLNSTSPLARNATLTNSDNTYPYFKE